jgi:hypothetical protein
VGANDNEFDCNASLSRFSELSRKIEASTQDSKEQTEFDNIFSVTVKSNDGQIAGFTDGSTIVRNMPDFEPSPGVNYEKIIQPDPFKQLFAVGLTKSQVNELLKNPPTTRGNIP